ncbi:MAG: macro domain-containing protein [Gemmatimonadaceae bacterium]|nr:macro domain-containing protein [Gemmatimonadaceae bacterium]
MRLDIAIDDLAFVAADAIARPVNAELRATTPLQRRLEGAAGPTLSAQLRVTEPLDIGAAVVTAAGGLEAGLLIHAVVMTEHEAVSRTGVQRAMTSALQRARDWKLARVAFAPFGLGAGNLDVDEAAQVMVGVLNDHASAEFPREVTIVVENEVEAAAFRAARAWAWREAL